MHDSRPGPGERSTLSVLKNEQRIKNRLKNNEINEVTSTNEIMSLFAKTLVVSLIGNGV